MNPGGPPENTSHVGIVTGDIPTVVIVIALESSVRVAAWGNGAGALERLATWLRENENLRALVLAAAALEQAAPAERAELSALCRPRAVPPADSRGRWVLDRWDLRTNGERQLHLWHGRAAAACGVEIDPVDTAAGDGTRRKCKGCRDWVAEQKTWGKR